MTLSEAQAHLTNALEALAAARTAQSLGLKDRSVTRATLGELRAEVGMWQRTVSEMSAKAAGLRNARVKVASWS